MAFPTVQTADTQTGTVTTNSTSWSLTYPTNLQSGDLILGLIGIDGTGVPTWPAAFTTAGGSSGASFLSIAKKISDGTETGTFTVTTPSEQGGWFMLRVTAWGGSGSSEASWGNSSAGIRAPSAGITAGATANPDSGNLDPLGWGTDDTLWFSVMACDTSRTVSVYPFADNNQAAVSGGSGGATVAYCTTNSAVSALNPGQFTISASDEWSAVTIAVCPAASVPRKTKLYFGRPGYPVLRASLQ